MKPLVKLLKLGRMSYGDALNIQTSLMKNLVNAVSTGQTDDLPNSLILVEHDPVYTIGIRSQIYTRESEEELKKLGADFVRTNRGGLITFHGPGQLVAYPIVYLGSFEPVNKSIKAYVHQLEQSIIDLCKHFGIDSSVICGLPGVWVDQQRKVAAIGVHCSRMVTMHGVAVNCDVDLDWFKHIVPCGIEDKTVTSVSKEINRIVTIEEAIPAFIQSFCKNFECDIR